jgi:Uma2 family endonuclease
MSDMANAPAYITHLVTVDEYHRMAAGGVFDADARIELIDGELIERVSPSKPAHASAVSLLTERLNRAFADIAMVRVQSPITLGSMSEPEPDIALVSIDEYGYQRHHPTLSDVFLLLEATDSTLWSDRRKKMPFYARRNVAEVWLVDLVNMCVHAYREPRAGTYTAVRRFERGERIAPLAFPSVVLEITELLPRFSSEP